MADQHVPVDFDQLEEKPITAIQFLQQFKFWSRERKWWASGSEMRRWLKDSSVLFNAEKMEPNEPIDFPLISVVLFHKSEKNRITLL